MFRHKKNTATALSSAGEKKYMQFVLGIPALSTTGNDAIRPMLLLLLIVAVILILVGCGIALLTLWNQRKDKLAFITVEKSESDRETY